MAKNAPEKIEDIYAPHVEVTPPSRNQVPLEKRLAYRQANKREGDPEQADRRFGKKVAEQNRVLYREIIEASLSSDGE